MCILVWVELWYLAMSWIDGFFIYLLVILTVVFYELHTCRHKESNTRIIYNKYGCNDNEERKNTDFFLSFLHSYQTTSVGFHFHYNYEYMLCSSICIWFYMILISFIHIAGVYFMMLFFSAVHLDICYQRHIIIQHFCYFICFQLRLDVVVVVPYILVAFCFHLNLPSESRTVICRSVI